MKKVSALVAMMVITLGLSACATVFKGGNQSVPVSSDPQGAEVLINGISYGVTPLTLDLEVDRQYTLVLRQGGQEETFFLRSEIGTLWIILDVVSGLVPVIIDAATGDWYELEPGEVFVSFDQ